MALCYCTFEIFAGAPVFVEPPVPKEVVQGEILRMTCYVQANPQASLEWFKDGQLIEESSSAIAFR